CEDFRACGVGRTVVGIGVAWSGGDTLRDGAFEDQTMTDRWSDLVRKSGDANLGQTLMRLAKLESAAQQFAVAEAAVAGCGSQLQAGGVGLHPAIQHGGRTDADESVELPVTLLGRAQVRTEVDL